MVSTTVAEKSVGLGTQVEMVVAAAVVRLMTVAATAAVTMSAMAISAVKVPRVLQRRW